MLIRHNAQITWCGSREEGVRVERHVEFILKVKAAIDSFLDSMNSIISLNLLSWLLGC